MYAKNIRFSIGASMEQNFGLYCIYNKQLRKSGNPQIHGVYI